MRQFSPVLLVIALAACSEPPGDLDSGTTPMDAGMPTDAGSSARDSGQPLDGGEMTGCPVGEHDCGGTCVGDMVNEPANGCRLGCGEACEGGSDAICRDDGTCGLRSCVPETCESLAAECGVVDDGCGGRRNCGACDTSLGQMCRDNVCGCTPDAHEPNESHIGLTSMTTLNDAGSETPFPIDGNLHSSYDEDWYQITVVDGGFDGNPRILVELEGVPSGSDYYVAAYFDCQNADTAGNSSSCSVGAVDNMIERGCTSAGRTLDQVVIETECAGTIDESGTLWVRVAATSWGGACANYTVRVTVT